jgi:hypothetical protein
MPRSDWACLSSTMIRAPAQGTSRRGRPLFTVSRLEKYHPKTQPFFFSTSAPTPPPPLPGLSPLSILILNSHLVNRAEYGRGTGKTKGAAREAAAAQALGFIAQR